MNQSEADTLLYRLPNYQNWHVFKLPGWRKGYVVRHNDRDLRIWSCGPSTLMQYRMSFKGQETYSWDHSPVEALKFFVRVLESESKVVKKLSEFVGEVVG